MILMIPLSQSNFRLKSLQSSPPSSLSSWTESSSSSKKVSISQMVLEEMRGRNPEPVRPASGAKYELDLAHRVDELIREAAAARRRRQGFEQNTEGGALSLTENFVVSFHVYSIGRWAILLLLSSQASNKMLEELLKRNV